MLLTPLRTDDSSEHKPATATSTIPRLVPVPMEPHVQTGVAVPLAALRRIEKIEINRTVERLGATLFVMDVFLRPANQRLPIASSILTHVRRKRPIDGGPRKADYQVEARFSDFAHLRADVSAFMCPNARFTCGYCAVFDEYILFRVRQPRWIVKVSTRVEHRKAILESFINDFVRMAQLRVSSCEKCLAHAHVPFVVEEFVRRRPSGPDADQVAPTTMSNLQLPPTA